MNLSSWFIIKAGVKILSVWMVVVGLLAGLMLGLAKYGRGGLTRPSTGNTIAIDCTYADYLYFSIITTTTVGYGDYYPVGYLRLVACAEAIVGLLAAGVFVAKVTSELLDPLLVARKAAGWWVDKCEIKKDGGKSDHFITVHEIKRSAGRWMCVGTNLNFNGTHRHDFIGYITGADEQGLYVPYRNDEAAKDDFTSGVWILSLKDSSDGLWYKSYSHDVLWGRRDSSVGIKLHNRRDRKLIKGLRSTPGSTAAKAAVKEAADRLTKIAANTTD